MTWNGTTPVFESYTPAPNGSGGVDGRFVTAGSQMPAEPTSGYAPPYNKVVIVVKASDLGLNPGDTISGFVSGVSYTAEGVVTGLFDQMPDSLAFTGTYVVNDNQVCRPNTPPTAVLTATPTQGTAPLSVALNGSGSFDPDTDPPADTIASYTFNFGDGSPAVTQSTPTIAHTYTAAGNFPARLTVTDSRGAQSTNTAQVMISVASAPSPTPTPAPTPTPTSTPTHCPTITLNPSTLPNGTVGHSYNKTIKANGGSSPYSFSVITGSLPPGLTLTSAGVLSGTPTSSGTFTFVVQARDHYSFTGTRSYSLSIAPH